MLRKTFSIVGLVLGCLALLFAIVAVGTTRWYVIDTDTSLTQLGLKTMCVTDKSAGGQKTCEDITLKTSDLTTCTREEDDVKSRFLAVQVVTAFMVILIFASILMNAIQVMKSIFIVKTLIAVFSVISIILGCIAFGVYVHTLEAWFFCDTDFCDYYAAFYAGQTCDSSLGYSCIFVIIAFVSMVAQLVFAMIAVKAHRPDAPVRGGGHGPQYDHAKNGGRHNVGDTVTPRHGADPDDHQNYVSNQPAAQNDCGDEDWVLDADTGYMWSETQQMYFDEDSGHYFNPDYNQWYNPDTEEWYEA